MAIESKEAPPPEPEIDDLLGQAIRNAVRQPLVIDSLCRSLEHQLRQQLGGGSVYIGKRGSREQQRARDSEIAQAFTGDNLDELGKRFNLHPRHVRRIVKRKK